MLSYVDSAIEHVLDIAVCSQGKKPCPNSQQVLYHRFGTGARPGKESLKSLRLTSPRSDECLTFRNQK
jgi:hypothetical protein